MSWYDVASLVPGLCPGVPSYVCPDASMWPSTTKSTLHCSFWTRDSRCRWPFSIALSQTIQLMEHSGCASSRLTALLAVVRDDPHQAPLTSRPPDLGPLPDPVPGQPASSSGPTSSGLGSAALSMQLSQLLLYPQVPEESSPTLSPLTDGFQAMFCPLRALRYSLALRWLHFEP